MKSAATMGDTHRHYLPAAGHDVFLPFYDLISKLMGTEKPRRRLVQEAEVKPGQRVLEIGCGTGILLLGLKQQQPQAEVIGLDPDPKALARARHKAERAAIALQLDQGFADALPYADRSMDHVFSSYMFHHLDVEVRTAMLREVRRVLKPGGKFHLLDFARAGEGRQSGMRLFHRHERMQDNSDQRIVELMKQAGLPDAAVAGQDSVLFGLGRAALYRASAP